MHRHWSSTRTRYALAPLSYVRGFQKRSPRTRFICGRPTDDTIKELRHGSHCGRQGHTAPGCGRRQSEAVIGRKRSRIGGRWSNMVPADGVAAAPRTPSENAWPGSTPKNAVWQRNLSASHRNIGEVLLNQGNFLVEVPGVVRRATQGEAGMSGKSAPCLGVTTDSHAPS